MYIGYGTLGSNLSASYTRKERNGLRILVLSGRDTFLYHSAGQFTSTHSSWKNVDTTDVGRMTSLTCNPRSMIHELNRQWR